MEKVKNELSVKKDIIVDSVDGIIETICLALEFILEKHKKERGIDSIR